MQTKLKEEFVIWVMRFLQNLTIKLNSELSNLSVRIETVEKMFGDMLGALNNIVGAPSNLLNESFYPSFKKLKKLFFFFFPKHSTSSLLSSAKAF